MTVSADGKYAILFGIVGGYLNNIQIYITNLKKQGKIAGKFPLTPVFADIKNKFTVSIKFQRSPFCCGELNVYSLYC